MVIDFYPLKGFFKPKEKVLFRIKTNVKNSELNGTLNIFSLSQKVAARDFSCEKTDENADASLWIDSDKLSNGGYFAQLTVGEKTYTTAFDILDSWTDYPRYGYVSYFEPDKPNIYENIEAMTKYHINGVQFYDWQYRHDRLLSDTEFYLDPFDRAMSLDTINTYIIACHAYGMAAMPYLAVYAASLDFWNKHQEWGMFDKDQHPIMFEGLLGLANPTCHSGWFNHLDAECNRVLDKTDFDGLHIDQYGEPKSAFDNNGKQIDLPKAFVDFIDHQKNKNRGSVVFNAVGNWPTEEIAKSKADFMYIEVWDYTPTFKELMDIVTNAKRKSGGRPVVIPIYIKAKDFNNVLLADAVINACGATRLEIGDGEKLLSDPYFPKAENIGKQKLAILRMYWDFVVGYQSILGPNAKNVQMNVHTHEDIMIISRQNANCFVINLINCGYKNKWTKTIQKHKELKNIAVRIELDTEVKGVSYASPDGKDIMLKPLEYEVFEGVITTSVSILKYWSMIIIEGK